MTSGRPDTYVPPADDGQELAELLGRQLAQLIGYEMIGYERAASRITDVALYVLPGLLQTGEYAQVVLGESSNVGRRVMLRTERAGVLTRDEDPVELRAIVHVDTLTRPIAPAEVMRAQLAHLLRMAELPNVTIQVVAGYERWCVPMLVCPFTVLEFDDVAPIVHIEHYRGGAFLWEERDVRGFMAAADEIAQKAMTPARSAEVIAESIGRSRP